MTVPLVVSVLRSLHRCGYRHHALVGVLGEAAVTALTNATSIVVAAATASKDVDVNVGQRRRNAMLALDLIELLLYLNHPNTAADVFRTLLGGGGSHEDDMAHVQMLVVGKTVERLPARTVQTVHAALTRLLEAPTSSRLRVGPSELALALHCQYDRNGMLNKHFSGAKDRWCRPEPEP